MPLDHQVAAPPARVKTARSPGHPLDHPASRVIAVAVAALGLAALAFIHRHDLWPAREPVAAESPADPFVACMGSRRADIAKMKADGVIQQAQADQFVQRAEAMCRSEAAKAGSGVAGSSVPAANGRPSPPVAHQPARSF